MDSDERAVFLGYSHVWAPNIPNITAIYANSTAFSAFARHYLLAKDFSKKRGFYGNLWIVTMGSPYVWPIFGFLKIDKNPMVFAIETKKAAKMKIFAFAEVLLRIAQNMLKTAYFWWEFCMIWALLIEMWADMLRFDRFSIDSCYPLRKLKIVEIDEKSPEKREIAILAFFVIFG